MESIDISTGQHVTIQYEPATIGARMGALLLDYLFMGIYFWFVSAVCTLITRWIDNVIFYIVFLFPLLVYHFLFESFSGGKTLGKMIVKIRVTNIDGSIPGIGAYFLRWVLMPIDLFSFGGVGALFILFSSLHQRLGDMAAGTVVVKTNPSLALDLDASYYEFSDDYEPTFKEVIYLSDGQITFISNLLLTPKNQSAVSVSLYELAAKVKTTLKIDTRMNDRLFLETVVRDYNYYATLEI